MAISNHLKEIKDYIAIVIGTAMYTAGVAFFMLPYQLTTGGITGVSAIIYYTTGIEVQVSYFVINVFFLIAAVKILGWRFSIKTIWGVLTSTVWLWIWQRLLEDPVTGTLPQLVGDELFMACVLGAIIEGAGLAFCFVNNGSTGGTDILAACVNKYRDVSIGQVIMLADIFIISSCYFVFHDWHRVIFGFVLLITSSITIDYVIRRQHQAVEFKIFSRNYSMIADAINKEDFGVTVLEGVGWYTHTERKVLICICSKRYADIIMRAIKKVDPTAFVSVTYVREVYGEGFGVMKTKIKGQKPIIVFATNNAHKLEEVRQIMGDRFEVRSLKEIGCNVELPETHGTLEENALEKAQYISQYYGFDCFADDTGLEVDALNGAPGVYSARYAAIDERGNLNATLTHDSQENMKKLLHELEGKEGTERNARFRTVIALIYQGKEYFFEGIVNGQIATEKHGNDGFGYDPVFYPEGHTPSETDSPVTFAEMSAEEKNNISHRGRAVEKLAKFFV